MGWGSSVVMFVPGSGLRHCVTISFSVPSEIVPSGVIEVVPFCSFSLRHNNVYHCVHYINSCFRQEFMEGYLLQILAVLYRDHSWWRESIQRWDYLATLTYIQWGICKRFLDPECSLIILWSYGWTGKFMLEISGFIIWEILIFVPCMLDHR